MTTKPTYEELEQKVKELEKKPLSTSRQMMRGMRVKRSGALLQRPPHA